MTNIKVAFRYKNQNLTRCSVCGNAKSYYYRQPIGEQMYNFCSGAHLNVALEDYKTKKNLGFEQEIISGELGYTDEIDNGQ